MVGGTEILTKSYDFQLYLKGYLLKTVKLVLLDTEPALLLARQVYFAESFSWALEILK